MWSTFYVFHLSAYYMWTAQPHVSCHISVLKHVFVKWFGFSENSFHHLIERKWVFFAINVLWSTQFSNTCQLPILQETLLVAIESVLNKAREVELQEKIAKQAKEEASRVGLDILTEVENVKQMVHQAKETYDMVVYSCSYNCSMVLMWTKTESISWFGSMLGKFLGREPFSPLKHENFNRVFSIYQMKKKSPCQLLMRFKLRHDLLFPRFCCSWAAL